MKHGSLCADRGSRVGIRPEVEQPGSEIEVAEIHGARKHVINTGNRRIRIDEFLEGRAIAESRVFRRLRPHPARNQVAHQRLTDSFLDIGERMCFEPTLAREFGPQRKASIRLAIDGLPTALAAGDGAAPPGARTWEGQSEPK